MMDTPGSALRHLAALRSWLVRSKVQKTAQLALESSRFVPQWMFVVAPCRVVAFPQFAVQNEVMKLLRTGTPLEVGAVFDIADSDSDADVPMDDNFLSEEELRPTKIAGPPVEMDALDSPTKGFDPDDLLGSKS